MRPFRYELSRPTRLEHRVDTRAFRQCVDNSGAVRANTKRCITWFLPWATVFVVSSAIAYVINLAVVGGGLGPQTPAEALAAAPAATSHELLDSPQESALDSCLKAWRQVSPHWPTIYAAGLEQFVDGGCSAPATRKVLIVAVDPATDERAQLECDAALSAFASDVVFVNASDFPAVSQACVDNPAALGLRP